MNRLTFKPKPIVLVALLLPGILIYSISSIFPLFVSAWYSFFDWSGGPVMKFVGFQNYLDMIRDQDFWLSFKNNLIFVIWTVFGQIGIAFIITMLLMSKILKLKEFYRTVIFFPVVLSAVVVGFLWAIIYNKDYGLMNLMLKSLKLDFLIRPWLDDPNQVIVSLAIPKIWQ
jgi:raffinose/stachyose/melibiose transport system permease protein